MQKVFEETQKPDQSVPKFAELPSLITHT